MAPPVNWRIEHLMSAPGQTR